MNEQTITIGKASATLSDVVGLAQGFKDKAKYLSHLYVDKEHRKNGAARKFMQQITSEAEQAKVTLIINPVPYDEQDNIGTDKLIEFYKQYNFTELQKDPLLLVRWVQVDLPKPTEKKRIITFA